MRKRRYVSLQGLERYSGDSESDVNNAKGIFYTVPTVSTSAVPCYDADAHTHNNTDYPSDHPMPRCHNIVSTSQIKVCDCKDGKPLDGGIDLERLSNLYAFTTYDKKRFAAITIRMANPHCTCLLFGSGKLVITGSTSYYACILASLNITTLLRQAYPLAYVAVSSCVIQNIVAHVEFPPGTCIDLDAIYKRFCECTTYQRTVFPGLVLRPPQSPIVLLVFSSGRIVCTGGRSYDDIRNGFAMIYRTLATYIAVPDQSETATGELSANTTYKRKRKRAGGRG